MPKKPKICWSCKHDISVDSCRYIRCHDCTCYLAKPVEGMNGQLVYCKCLTVKDGEECPYYEEA